MDGTFSPRHDAVDGFGVFGQPFMGQGSVIGAGKIAIYIGPAFSPATYHNRAAAIAI
jgi:hypothetical protein